MNLIGGREPVAQERWPSGLRRRFAKPMYGRKAVPGVQIPTSPYSFRFDCIMRQQPKSNLNKKNLRHNYFDIIINENGDIHIEPWDELWGKVFKKNTKLLKNSDTKIYKYCG